MFNRAILFTLFVSGLPCSACGGGPSAADAAKQKPENKEDAAFEAAIAKRKAEREAKEKAEREAEENKAAAIDAAITLPEEMPELGIDEACEEVSKAHDRFMTRLFEGDALEKWNSGVKDTQLPMTKVQCTQADSLEVAVCQAHALDAAGPELKKALPELLRGCISKYAKKARPGPGAAPPKPG
jgi:hypothetical protein